MEGQQGRPLDAAGRERSDSTSQNERDDFRSILLVDDSYAFRERLALAFRERGFAVRTASCFDEAIEVVEQYSPDVAVVDLRMPGRSGLDLVREIKTMDESICILVLSGFGSIATAIDAIRLGAVNFLPKPADADDVLNALRRGNGELRTESPVESIAPETPSLARAEWEHIHRVLSDCEGNVSEAARRLGIHRRSLQRKLRKRAPE